MEEDESTCLARICQVNHGGDNQASYCFQVFKCLTSAQCHTICRTLSIVLLPGLILFGGITIFITGCLINIPPMIIGGAAMFVLGILFCLLCGHACDGLTKRVRKPRHSRDETKPVLVWFQIAGFFFFFLSLLDNTGLLAIDGIPLNGEVYKLKQISRWSSAVVSAQWRCSRTFSCLVLQRYVATHMLLSESDFEAPVIQIVTTRKWQQRWL